jgi:hypothetical protein
MLTVSYVFFLLPISSCILCVFGFFVGRCARKLPVIDNGLPWAISRSQIPPWRDSAGEALPPGQTGGPSGLDIAGICDEAGWISPVNLPEQAHPVSPESHANGGAA